MWLTCTGLQLRQVRHRNTGKQKASPVSSTVNYCPPASDVTDQHQLITCRQHLSAHRLLVCLVHLKSIYFKLKSSAYGHHYVHCRSLIICWNSSTVLAMFFSYGTLSAGLSTRLTRLQSRAPDFLGAPTSLRSSFFKSCRVLCSGVAPQF